MNLKKQNQKTNNLTFFKIFFGNLKMDKNKCPKMKSRKKSWKKIELFVCDHKKSLACGCLKIFFNFVTIIFLFIFFLIKLKNKRI